MVKIAGAVIAAVVLLAGAFAVGRLTGESDTDAADESPSVEEAPTDPADDGTPEIRTGSTSTGGTVDRNVVVINADDLPTSLWDYLPRTRELLSPSGIEFTNHIVSTSTCCPSRVSLFSGLEPQNHGVINNVQPFGSAARYDHDRSFVVSLQEAGYATGHYGKYLNGFNAIQPFVPPGWDDFHALVFRDSDFRGYYEYGILENGESVLYGTEPEVYSTRLFGERTVDFIDANAGVNPFFAYYAPFAPHTPAIAEEAYDGTLDDLEVPVPPNFNEDDVSDKPRWVQESEPLTDERVEALEQQYRDMAESLATLDEMVVDIVDALERGGVMDDTLIVFASDNGLLLGAHRQTAKECPYDECVRTPLLIHHPDATVVGTSTALVSPTDYAPTILDWLDVQPGWQMDGYSMLSAFTDSGWYGRDAKLIQVLGRPFNQNRNFIGLRTETHTYVEYTTGERELYDLVADPFQLDNVIDDPAQGDLITELASELDGRRGETDLSLSFEIDDPDVARGDEIELTFTVTNNGRRMANHVYVVYDTPDAFRTVDCAGTDEARCYSFGTRQEVRFMAIDPGQSVTGSVRLLVREGAFAEAVAFEAELSFFNTIDPDPANDVDRFELIIT